MNMTCFVEETSAESWGLSKSLVDHEHYMNFRSDKGKINVISVTSSENKQCTVFISCVCV